VYPPKPAGLSREKHVARLSLKSPFDAVRALGHVRDRDRDELLGLLWQRSVGEDGLAEALESVVDAGCQLLAALGLLGGGGVVQGLTSKSGGCRRVSRPGVPALFVATAPGSRPAATLLWAGLSTGRPQRRIPVLLGAQPP
jgi:hypothetical protein